MVQAGLTQGQPKLLAAKLNRPIMEVAQSPRVWHVAVLVPDLSKTLESSTVQPVDFRSLGDFLSLRTPISRLFQAVLLTGRMSSRGLIRREFVCFKPSEAPPESPKSGESGSGDPRTCLRWDGRRNALKKVC